MSALVAAAVVAGAAAAAKLSADAIKKKKAADAIKPTDEEFAELELLQGEEAAGAAALTNQQDAAIRQQFLAEQGAQAREQQAAQLQAVAARNAGTATAGREIFLAEQAAQQGALARTQQRNLALTQAEDAAAADRQARISFLQQRQEAYELAKAGADAAAVTVPLEAGGEALGAYGSTWGEMAVAGTLPPEEPPPEDDWVNQTTTGY